MARFLNVDLVVTSKEPLETLVEAMGDEQIVVLHADRAEGLHRVTLELYEFSRFVDADACIAKFVELVRGLPSSARRCWDGAERRCFDVGIEGEAARFRVVVAPATLAGVVEVGGEIAISVYARLGPPTGKFES